MDKLPLEDELDNELEHAKKPKPTAANRAHCKLVVGMLCVFCFVLLVGGGVMYPYTAPTPKLSAAASSCADPPPYRYFTPVEWATACRTEHNKTDAARIRVVVRALESFLPCRACSSRDTCSNNTACVPSATAQAADSDAVLAIMTAAHCAAAANVSVEDAFNATMYASTLDRWTHALEPGNVAAMVLRMWGYNTTEQCMEYEECTGLFCFA